MTRKSSVSDLLLSQAVAAGSSLLAVVATAHFLGVEGRGELAFVLGLANLLGALSFGSLHVGATRATASGAGNGRLVAIQLAALTAILVTAGAVVLGLVLWATTRSDLASLCMLAGVGAGLVTINLATLRIGQAAGDDRGFRNAWITQGVGFLLAGSVTAALTAVSALVVLTWFIFLVLSTVLMGRRIAWRESAYGTVTHREVLTSSWRAHSGTVGTQILTRMPLVALGVSSTTTQAGLYSVAAPIAEATWLISEAFSLLSFRAEARQESGSVDNRWASRAHAIVTTAGGLLVGVGGFVLLPVLLPEFADARLLVLVLIPGVLIQGNARVAMARLVGRGTSSIVLLIGTLSAAASISLFLAAGYSGALGVAILASSLYAIQGVFVIIAERAMRAVR